MIDATPQQSRDYLKTIEAPAVTQDQIDIKAHEILRGLTASDICEVLYDFAEQFKTAALLGIDESVTGAIVHGSLKTYCQRIARRELEA